MCTPTKHEASLTICFVNLLMFASVCYHHRIAVPIDLVRVGSAALLTLLCPSLISPNLRTAGPVYHIAMGITWLPFAVLARVIIVVNSFFRIAISMPLVTAFDWRA